MVPRPPTDRTTNSIAFILLPINETVTNRAVLNWFRAPKRFNLWLSGNFWIDSLLYSLWETKNFRKSQIEVLWCQNSVQSSAISDRFVYWMYYECNGISGPESVCVWSRDHKKLIYDIILMTSHFFRNVSFACEPCIMANNTLKMTKYNYEKSWSGTTRTIKFGPHICDIWIWIDALLYSLWETKIYRKSQIEALLVPEISSEQRDLWPFWLLHVA